MNSTIQFHVFLSTLAFAVLCFAAILALLLATQEYLLRDKRVKSVVTFLPSIERMENLLFRVITLGFGLLTLVVITAFWFFRIMPTPILWHKISLSLFAWMVFFVLLVGRYSYGWRGRTAIRWTLGGVFLVTLVYFGSELL